MCGKILFTGIIIFMLISTQNVNGFRYTIKGAKVFELVNIKKIDIPFLQETCFYSNSDINNVKRQWKSKSFWSYSKSSHTSGTAVLISPNLDCKVESFHFDLNGCSVVLDVCIKVLKLRLISVYAPVNTVDRKQ